MLLLHQSSIIISFIQQDKKKIKYLTSRHTEFLISVKVCGNSYFLNEKICIFFHLYNLIYLSFDRGTPFDNFIIIEWKRIFASYLKPLAYAINKYYQLVKLKHHVFITWRKYLAPFILLTLSLYRSSSRLLKKVRQSHHNSDSIRLSSEPLLTLPLTRASVTRWRRISQG